MDGVDHHSAVGEALEILVQGLTPFVERVFADALPPNHGVESLMLRVMTARLGDLGYQFSQHLSRQGLIYASELQSQSGVMLSEGSSN
jgi:hypothetical protein